MDFDQRCLRLCAAVLICSVLFRLAASGAFAPIEQWLAQPSTASFLMYLQTGRVIRASAEEPPLPLPTMIPTTIPPPTQSADSTESTQSTQQETTAPAATSPQAPATFSGDELEHIRMYYRCDYRPELAPLLTGGLDWELHSDEPKVLIVHTHTSESYTPLEPGEYEPSGDYRTLDPNYNVLSVGDVVCSMLEEAGIGVLHDREFHDTPSYNDSYSNTRISTEQILSENPSIELIIDLHRDAADTPAGQLVTECQIGDDTAAQLMMVVGTDDCGLEHPDWQKNLAVALKLQALLERENPGICRKLTLSNQRYNQHLGRHALLIEVGAAGNTLPEAKLAAAQLAKAIIALSHGSQ